MIVDAGATNVGAIESLDEARLCADSFRSRRDEIDGVLVTLPNFGDERAIANVLRWSEPARTGAASRVSRRSPDHEHR